MELAVGNFVTFEYDNATQHHFQNFFIGDTITYSGASFGFLPFGFSGVTINRTGDGTESFIILPNNAISKNWTVEACDERWLAHVEVMLLDPEDKTSFTRLHQYWGKVISASWDDTTIKLALSGVLDAVGSDVPMRRLTQKYIGAIPVTNVLQLQ